MSATIRRERPELRKSGHARIIRRVRRRRNVGTEQPVGILIDYSTIRRHDEVLVILREPTEQSTVDVRQLCPVERTGTREIEHVDVLSLSYSTVDRARRLIA